MPEPITFPTATNTFALPFLFAGQAQKEFFVNQSLALIDSLLRHSVNGSHVAPPADAAEGESYRILDMATEEWAGHDGDVAVLIGGAWQFIAPFDGMQMFDQAAGQFLIFRSGWVDVNAPADVQGGSVVDVEARSAIADLSQALRSIGILGEHV